MDFRACVITSCAHDPASGLSWWEQLFDEANVGGPTSDQHNLRRNIEETMLFTIDSSHQDHVADFCTGLKRNDTGNAVERALNTIKETGRMICAGPAAVPFGSPACVLITFTSFTKRYIRPSIRGPRGSTLPPSVVLLIWTSLGDSNHYKDIIDNSEEYKSNIPNRFWAALRDIEDLETREVVDALRLRQFLGLDDKSIRTLLIAIEEDKEPSFYIPTGWDGFTHQHFRENREYEPTDATTHFGYTLDLMTGRRGARELVTKPVSTQDTRLIGRYE